MVQAAGLLQKGTYRSRFLFVVRRWDEARREAARNNSIAMMIGAAAKMTHTTSEFQNLLKAALPDLPVIKALPASTDKADE